jgi:hypothetical protein
MIATLRHRRRRATLATAVVLAVLASPLVTAGVSLAAGNTTERQLSAQLVIDSHITPFVCGNCGPGGTPETLMSCQFYVFVQFSPVPLAQSYSVVVKDRDPRVAPSRTLTGPPFSDVGPPFAGEPGEFRAPAGTHRLGPLTGGSGPASSCPTEPTLNGRLSITKAVAILPTFCKGVPGARFTASWRAVAAQDPSCPTPPKYTQEQKDYAKERRRAYAAASLLQQTGALGLGSYSLYLGATGVGAAPAAIAGAASLVLQGTTIYYNYEAEQWARIQEDPPDKKWRTVVKPIATDATKLALPRDLSAAKQKQVRALMGSIVRSAALSDCVAKAIDRGTTALPKSGLIAAKQYAAGAACSRAHAKLAAALPRLAAPVIAFLRPLDAQVLADSPKAPRDARFRREIAKDVATLGRVISLTPKELTNLRAKLLASTAPLTVAPSVLLEQVVATAAAEAPRLRSSASALAAAAKGR